MEEIGRLLVWVMGKCNHLCPDLSFYPQSQQTSSPHFRNVLNLEESLASQGNGHIVQLNHAHPQTCSKRLCPGKFLNSVCVHA